MKYRIRQNLLLTVMLPVWAMLFMALGVIGLTPSAHAQGFLIPTQSHIEPLSIKFQRVQVEIQDRAARTTVTQVFTNHTDRILEATYIFPVPADAIVSNFVLYINGKPKTGTILVKERATQIYQSIVRRMQDPGLLEYMGGRLFRARIFPIPRRGDQKIQISFTQLIPYTGGLHRFVYPLKTNHRTRRTLQDFTMAVNLRSQTPLKNIYSPTHQVSLARKSDNFAIVGFEKNQALLDRDFVLYYSVSPKDIGLNLLSSREKGQDGYFLMMMTPKVSYGSQELSGKNITFVLDTSGSMSGPKMRWAKETLKICLGKLNPKDHFNVIRFSTDVEPLFAQMELASAKQIQHAQAFVDRMEAAGGTAIDEALRLALSQKPKGDGVSLVVFITDGHPTIGETTPAEILKNSQKLNRYKSRIFTFGIGTDININLLDKIAQSTGGTGDYVAPNEEITQRIATFYDKVRYPVLTNIQLTVGSGIRIHDMYPKTIPDLFRGGQIAMFGRYRGQGSVAIILKGSVGGQQKQFVFETRFPETSDQHSFISRLWAHRKIAYLLDHIRLKGLNTELREEIIRLSKKFGIVTPYTSYLVVEDQDDWRLRDPQQQAQRPLIQTRPGLGTRWRNGQGMGGAEQDHRRPTDNGATSEARPRADEAPRKAGASRTAQPRRSWGRRDNAPTEPEPSTTPMARPTTPAPPPVSLKDLQEESGKKAVDHSRYLKEMKQQNTITSSTRTRFVKGKLFVWKQGGWRDNSFKTSMKILKIRYMSNLYFQVLQHRPDLRSFFALGRRITLVISKDRAIEIGTEDASFSASQLQHFLRK